MFFVHVRVLTDRDSFSSQTLYYSVTMLLFCTGYSVIQFLIWPTTTKVQSGYLDKLVALQSIIFEKIKTQKENDQKLGEYVAQLCSSRRPDRLHVQTNSDNDRETMQQNERTKHCVMGSQ